MFAGLVASLPSDVLTWKRERPIGPIRWTNTTVVSSSSHSADPSTKTIQLSLSPQSVPKLATPIWSLYIKDTDIQIERPFTPLYGIDTNGQVELWVRQYKDGEMGRWICQQPIGSVIEVRGPVQTLDWTAEEGRWDYIVMISGGTGITPMLQLLDHIFKEKQPSSTARFTLLHASRTPSQLPPSRIVSRLKSYADQHRKQFKFRFFVDSQDETQHRDDINELVIHRIGRSDIETALQYKRNKVTIRQPSWIWRLLPRDQDRCDDESSCQGRTLILVCGPHAMVSAIAGARSSDRDSGPVAGLLGGLGFDSNNVRKL